MDAGIDRPHDAPIEQKSRWEDYLDVFFAPADLFRRRGHDKVMPPLLTLLVLGTLFYYILLPAQGIIMRAALPPEQLAKMPGNMMTIMQIAGGIAVPVMYLVSVAAAALVMWILVRLLSELKPEFRDMMIIATYAAFVILISQIAGSIVAMVHGEVGLDPRRDMSFGILRFMDVENLSAPVMALASRVDIFRIWQAVIWAIGLKVVLGLTREKAGMIAGGTWLLFAVPGMLGGGMGAKMPAGTPMEAPVE